MRFPSCGASLKGDMHFVGPRPERPEFVEWLAREIPYYGVRHVVRPGITAGQVQYKYATRWTMRARSCNMIFLYQECLTRTGPADHVPNH